MSPPDDLLVALNYYTPYVSGLSDTAKVLAEGLATRGWRVTVVTSRHDRSLLPRELLGGVHVVRTPVLARVGKGTISPHLPIIAARAARRSTVLNLHLPMLEAGLIARLCPDTPLVATYQCDINLPPGRLNQAQVSAVDASSRRALRGAAAVVPSSDDYAENSRLWPAMRGKTTAISPPCQDRRGGRPIYRDGTGMHVGFLGRIVEEKGLDYLIDGFLGAAAAEDRLLIGGDHTKIAGGSVIDAVRARTKGDPRIRFLGFLPDQSLADFYASIDAFALPSVNSLEAFGIVQVEAMMTGVPAIASDLPGVRTPIRATDFGIIVPPRNAAAITAAITTLKHTPPDPATGAQEARRTYGAQQTIDRYETLLRAVDPGLRRP